MAHARGLWHHATVTPPTASKLRIQERFVSLQGEGLLVGVPSAFVRVAGCNLRCAWCDSPKTSWAPEGEMTSVDELVQWCAAGPQHVVLTGGEPLLFPAMAELSQALRRQGHHITIESAGTVWCEGVVADLMSLSPKLDHSSPREVKLATVHARRRSAPEVLRRYMQTFAWQLKFVVRTSKFELAEDLVEIEGILQTLGVADKARTRVLLMPETTDPKALPEHYARLVPVCLERGFRLGERLHIAIFGHRPGT